MELQGIRGEDYTVDAVKTSLRGRAVASVAPNKVDEIWGSSSGASSPRSELDSSTPCITAPRCARGSPRQFQLVDSASHICGPHLEQLEERV